MSEIALDNAALVPPHNREWEEATAGAMLISTKAVHAALSVACPEDFYFHPLRQVFETCALLTRSGHPVDLLTVADRLGWQPGTEGFKFLDTLASNVPTSAHARHYAEKVRELADLRRWLEFLDVQRGKVYAREASAEALQAEFVRFATQSRGKTAVLQDAGTVAYEEFERIQEGKAEEVCFFGLPRLDRKSGGVAPGEVATICGQPGAGKTIAGWMQAEHCALTWGPVLVVSLEMAAEMLVRRSLAGKTGFTFRELRDAGRWDEARQRVREFSTNDLERIGKAANEIYNLPHAIKIDTNSYRLSELIHRLHVYKAEYGLRGVVIDYGQLLEDDRGRAESRSVEMGRIARAIKNEIAVALGLCVWVLNQPSREVDRRGGGQRKKGEDGKEKPALLKMSDMAWSREWEASATHVWLINVDPDCPGTDSDRGILWHVAKNRNGEVGMVRMILDAPRFRFVERAERDDAPPLPEHNPWWDQGDE